jgi:hypothetical protein
MITPAVTELSRSAHRRQVELVRASLLRGVTVKGDRSKAARSR